MGILPRVAMRGESVENIRIYQGGELAATEQNSTS